MDAEQQGVVSQSAERRFRFLGASSPVAGGLEQQPGRGVHVLSTCLFLSADFAENVSLIFWGVALTVVFCFFFSIFPSNFCQFGHNSSYFLMFFWQKNLTRSLQILFEACLRRSEADTDIPVHPNHEMDTPNTFTKVSRLW